MVVINSVEWHDVASLCLKIMPKGKDQLISMADLMAGVQKIKNKLSKDCLEGMKND